MKRQERDREVSRLVKAMAHPIRVQVLRILGTRIASPSQMAQETGENVGSISYHVKVLGELGCVELVDTEPRRGATEHFYRSTSNTYLRSSEWRTIPEPLRGRVAAAAFNDLSFELFAALEAATFQRLDGASLSCHSIRVDETAWLEIVEILENTEREVQGAAQRAATRLEKQSGFPIVVAWTSFEASDESRG